MLMTYYSASVVLKESQATPGAFYLHSLYSLHKRQGHGTALLNRVCAWADAYGHAITLAVGEYGNHPDNMRDAQLEAWYKKFGFVRRTPPAESGVVYMIRQPREKNSSPNEK